MRDVTRSQNGHEAYSSSRCVNNTIYSTDMTAAVIFLRTPRNKASQNEITSHTWCCQLAWANDTIQPAADDGHIMYMHILAMVLAASPETQWHGIVVAQLYSDYTGNLRPLGSVGSFAASLKRPLFSVEVSVFVCLSATSMLNISEIK